MAMTSLVRALWILVGVAAAGLLVWVATRPDGQTNSGYWATLGILAGAGLALALIETVSLGRTRDRPNFSVPVLLLCFVPALIAAGWIMVAGQPDPNWLRTQVDSWSGHMGIGGLVADVIPYVTVLAFGLGLLFGFSFEPVRRRRVEGVGIETAPVIYRSTRETDELGSDEVPAERTDEVPTERTRAA
jgi:hypothetical protein